MNSLYVGIGTAIVVALVTALIGPFFVDWNAWRGVIEAEARRVAGIEIRVLGDIDARLLPSPRIRLADVIVGGVERPLLHTGHLLLDLDLLPLMKGEIRLAEVGLDHPEMRLTLDTEGRPIGLPTLAAVTHEAAIDRLVVTGGRFDLTSADGAALRLDAVEATATAPALLGPWKAEGRAARDGHPFAFRFATSTTREGEPAVRLALLPDDLPLAADLDLHVAARADTAPPRADAPAAPRLAGRVTLEPRRLADAVAPPRDLSRDPPWRLTAAVAVTPSAIEMTEIAATLGAPEHETTVSGAARLRLGADPALDLTLETRRLDLDRLLAAEGEQAATPAEAGAPSPRATLGGLADRLAPLFDALPPGRLDLETRTLTLAGTEVQDLGLSALRKAGAWRIDRLAAKGPGRSSLEVTGTLRPGGALAFDGRVDLAADHPSALLGWWTGHTETAPGEPPLDPLRLAGRLKLDEKGLRGDDLRLSIGPTDLTATFDRPFADVPSLDLTARRLDLDRLLRFARAAAPLLVRGGASGLALALHGDTVAFAGTTAGRVDVEARVDRDAVDVRKLEIGDLAGLAVTGAGRLADPLGTPKGAVDLHLTAKTLAPATRALALVTAPAFEAETRELLARGSDALAPLALDLRLAAHPEGDGLALSAAGTAAGRRLTLDLDQTGSLAAPRAARWTAAATLGDALAPDAGAAALPSLRLAVEGRPAERLKVDVDAAAPLGRLRFDGGFALPIGAAPRLDATLSLTTPDASPLGPLVGRPLAALASRVPLRLAARLEGPLGGLRLGGLTGSIGETKLEGEIDADVASRPARLLGRLHLDRLDAETVLDLALGTGVETTAPLAPAPLLDHLSADLTVSIDRVELDASRTLDDLATRLVLSAAETRVEHLTAGLADGRLALDATVSRPKDAPLRLAASGGLIAADVATLMEDTPVAALLVGLATLEGRLETTGRTTDALVAGLAGNLRLTLQKPGFAGLDPKFFDDLARGKPKPAPNAEALAARLDAARTRARLSVDRLEWPLSIEAGTLRLARSEIAGPTTRLALRGGLDLARGTLEGAVTWEPTGMSAANLETAVSKARPTLAGRLSGTFSAPRLDWDLVSLATWASLAETEAAIAETDALEKDVARRRAEIGAATPATVPATGTVTPSGISGIPQTGAVAPPPLSASDRLNPSASPAP